jgi:hypothetical protein
MDEEGLETLLRAWGRYYGEARPVDDSEVNAACSHPLARGMTMAPGKRSRVIRQRTTQDRGGQERRRLMAVAVGIKGLHIIAAHFADPIPCLETRRPVYGMGETSRPVPLELQRVQRAALDLLAFNRFSGLCVRIQYCARGPQDEKADRVADLFGEAVGLRRYREGLGVGRGFMYGRLAPAAAAAPG